MKVFLATIVAALTVPAAALGAGPTMIVRDVALHSSRTLAAVPLRFNMVGIHWQGTGSVAFRTRALTGVWSTWRRADADISPDRRSSENRLRGWRLGNLAWTATANAIRFSTIGQVARVRAYYVWSPPEATPARRLQLANAPPIIPRLSWGADESIRRAAPQFASEIQYAVVHHTAGANDYTAAESAGIVRGIELYHVKGNGWNDIGYNFLVDKYGQVFEGRYGGVEKAVIGAHAEGFNTGSVGVAVIGDYGTTQISAAARASLEQLLAWRLDLAHVDPLSTLTSLSGGNPRFPKGAPVLLRAISGHRDTNFTDCPGSALYAALPQIAKEVAALGGPKVFAPAAVGKLGGLIRFTAKLSAPLPWTVVVTDSLGAVAAQTSGTGPSIDWTWDATLAPLQRYTWTIATPGARSASGTFGSGSVALGLQGVTATPSQLAPGGDPSDDTTTVAYTLTAPATVTAALVDANAQVLSTLFSEAKPAGPQTFTFTAPVGLPAGAYTIQLAAIGTTGKTVSATLSLIVDDTLTGFAVAPAVFSTAANGSATLTFTLTRGPVDVELQVVSGADVVATQPAVTLQAGTQTMSWNGRLDDGTIAPDGSYALSLHLTDAFLTFTRTAPVLLDSTPPKITVVSYRTLRFRLSEPATLTLVVGATRYSRTLKSASATYFWLKQKPRAYRLIATDEAGNTSSVGYRSP